MSKLANNPIKEKLIEESKKDKLLQGMLKNAKQSSKSKSALIADKDNITYLHNLIYVPRIIRNKIIRIHYDLLTSGHQGIEKMHEQISKNYYMPNLWKEVTNYI